MNTQTTGDDAEQLISESELFENEGDTLDRYAGEKALALACYTKAASKLKTWKFSIRFFVFP